MLLPFGLCEAKILYLKKNYLFLDAVTNCDFQTDLKIVLLLRGINGFVVMVVPSKFKNCFLHAKEAEIIMYCSSFFLTCKKNMVFFLIKMKLVEII